MSNTIQEKTFDFAVLIVQFCKDLMNDKKEYVMSKQLLRSGTSIGANVEEAQRAQSKKDFISKMCIAQKEASESLYWLRLLKATDFGRKNKINEPIREVNEILALLGSIIKTSRANLHS